MAKFQVRARTVDMLGRQQIAGIPTSLHELFKNAHDAYADNVEVDYFRTDKSLLIRDDGIGMTKEDFETRWLTLGTESKLGIEKGISLPYVDPNKPVRTILGEKGIGRLAIAAVGRLVMVMSRAERNNKLYGIVFSLIHWRLFEIPGLNIHDIEIPVETWDSPGLPDDVFIKDKLIYSIKETVNKLKNEIPNHYVQEIFNDLDNFTISPNQLYSRLGGLSLAKHRGTHFLILPANPILEADIDISGEGDFSPPLKKNLIGFCNSMLPESPVPALSLKFRDHRVDGTIHDLINPGQEFFTPSDFNLADHHFDGEFDDFGQFNGTIDIYGGTSFKYTLSWDGGKGRPTQCGSFRIKLAYVQGLSHESKLPPEQYAAISRKLDQIGGIYIYKNDIRILPYGNSDYDWLGIERRRTKSASDHFFSYRRIFGVVEISRDRNPSLIEKAGREGFMENMAYRQMRDILQSFFIQVAKEHFRKSSGHAEEYWRIKEELKRQEELLKKRENRVRERKKKFASQLRKHFNNLEHGKPSLEVQVLEKDFEKRMQEIAKISEIDPKLAGDEYLKCEVDTKSKLNSLRKEFEIRKPAGLGLSKNQQGNWKEYLREFGKLEDSVFSPLENKINRISSEALQNLSVIVDQRRRIDLAINELKKQTDNQVQKIKKETTDEVKDLRNRVLTEVQERMTVLHNEFEKSKAKLERSDILQMSSSDVEQLQFQFEHDLKEKTSKELQALQNLRDQLGMLSDAITNNESITEVTSALEEQSEAYRDELNKYAEMAQIGTAVGILQHEFSGAFKLMEDNIRQLRGWSNANAQLREIYKNLRLNFEHLDEYMRALEPFNRRFHKRKIKISCQEVRYYLENLFADRLKRHNINLRGTRAFDNFRLMAYPSTIYPCFMNLVDNSIYWLTKDVDGMARVEKGKKEITLDATPKGPFVSDTGPGVNRRIADRIFEFSYSKKKGGRGMGLYVSREILRRDGLDLTLVKYGRGVHPVFQIQINSDLEEA